MRCWVIVILCFLLLFSTDSWAANKRRHKTLRREAKVREVARNAPYDQDALFRILVIEQKRALNDRYLAAALQNPNNKIAQAAILATGRIGDSHFIEDLSRFLNRKDAFRKKWASVSLALIEDDTAGKILQQNAPMQKDLTVLPPLYFSMGRSGSDRNMPSLVAAILDGKTPEIIRSACHGLGILWSVKAEKWDAPVEVLQKLAALSIEDSETADYCAFALSRYKGDPRVFFAVPVLERAQKAPREMARVFLIRLLSKIKSPAASDFLVQSTAREHSVNIRIEAAKALSTQAPNALTLNALKALLSETSPQLIVQSLDTLGLYGPSAAQISDSVQQLTLNSKSTWVKGTALRTLNLIQPVSGRFRTQEILGQPQNPLFQYAVASLPLSSTEEDMNRLAGFIGDEDIPTAIEAVDSLSAVAEEKITDSVKASLKVALQRVDPALTAMIAGLAERHQWWDFSTLLTNMYSLLQKPDHLEAKIAVLSALAAIGDSRSLPVIESALKEPEPMVVRSAISAYRNLAKKEASVQPPLNSDRQNLPFTITEINEAYRNDVELVTTQGTLRLRFLPDAPLTSLNFFRLCKKQFYNGLKFHRLVPGFVIQGGDPRGDGYGGPGYFIRDEVSLQTHQKGIVGMASSGKDTAGSQFFINLSLNPHLDSKFTAFGEITQGLDILDRMEIGDKILSTRLIPTSKRNSPF